MPNDPHYNKQRHRDWSDKVIRRAGYLCEHCKRYGRKVTATIAHHKKTVKECPELAYDVTNGEALCDACHNKEHPEKGKRNTIPPGKKTEKI